MHYIYIYVHVYVSMHVRMQICNSITESHLILLARQGLISNCGQVNQNLSVVFDRKL